MQPWPRYILFLCCFLVLSTVPAAGQSVPADLEIIATTSGVFPDGPASSTTSVRIAADGNGSFDRYLSGDLGAPEPETVNFSLSATEVEQLWQAIQSNNFFGLQEEYASATVRDRTIALLTVTADGTSHTVATRNTAVSEFDSILSAINLVVPAAGRLSYDVSDPFLFLPTAICDQPGKRTGPDFAAHPGTVVAYHVPLHEAISKNAATLSAKGEHFGDAVKIEVDNSGNIKSEDLKLTLYLELWGSGASANIAAVVESAIEMAWSGTTSGGKTFTVDVVTRVSPGGSDAPGTPGYHQIQMTPDSTYKSDVHEVNEPFGVNNGVGGGTWSSIGSDLEELYAHEAGHLFGIGDRYNDYNKQADGTWKRESDGQTFTNEELADEIAPQHPDLTKAEVLERVSKPGRQRVTSPRPGSVDDLMASMDGMVLQSDIDALAAMAGLLVEVRPGDMYVNKWGSRQNMATIRTEDIFVPVGGMKSLEGLYAICIDRSRGTPHAGDVFDVAPPLSDWNGFEVRDDLLMLLEHIDREELFCPADAFAQSVVWRLTNNAGMSNEGIVDYLAEVGIDVGYRDLIFPRMSNPNFADPNSSILTPPELYVPGIISAAGSVADVEESLVFTADLSAPSTNGIEPPPGAFAPAFSWSLDGPDESGATLDQTVGETSAFTPDVRGHYELTLRVDLADSLTGASEPGDGTFRQQTTVKLVAVDALVETFESGVLDASGPFLWKSDGNAWTVTDELSHTGGFSARSAPIGDNAQSTLRAKFDQVEAGTLSFTYKLFAHFTDSLFFSVDGVSYGRWSGFDPWTTVSVELTPGVHTASWSYVKDGSESIGADRAWLDDVFFPKSALFTGLEDANGADGPNGASHSPGSVFRLAGNYPNPFATATAIEYELSEGQEVRLTVFDALGREVAVVFDGYRAAGRHLAHFGAGELANGMYYYELRSSGNVRRRAMVVAK